MKSLLKIAAVCMVLSTFITANAQAQQTAKQMQQAAQQAAIQKAVETKNYTFVAQYALPLRGGQKYLTSDYDLKVGRDSVVAWLPYFGRVYMDPPMNHDDAGIMFTSTKFDYKKAEKKKGGWTIIITPKDNRYTSKFTLDIFPDGTAYLSVISNTRDGISFNGYIKGK